MSVLLRWLRALVTVLVAITLTVALLPSLVAPATAATAEVAANLRNSAVHISKYRGNVETSPDGSITQGCSSNSGDNDVTTVDATGAIAQRIKKSTACIHNVRVGADGTVYGIVYTGAKRGPLMAYRGGTLLWSYASHGCTNDLGADVAAGTNGNIYLTASQGHTGRLIGLDPGGREILNVSLPSAYGCGSTLQAYLHGVVVLDQLAVPRFYSYAGKFLGVGPKGDYWSAKVNHDGVLFMRNGSSVFAYSSLEGRTLWTVALPPKVTLGATATSILPLPSGGVLLVGNGPHMLDAANGLEQVPATTAKWLVFVRANGGIAQRVMLPHKVGSGTYTYKSVLVDTAGNATVVARRSSGSGQMLVSQYSSTGQPVGSTHVLSGDQTRGGKSSGLMTSGDDAFVGRDFVGFFAHCYGNGCNDLLARLYVVQMPGTTLDYPRGMVITGTTDKQPRPKVGVAMGDSYSGGEGVTPFIDAKNACHRSHDAYSQVLSRNPYVAFSLNEAGGKFVACSGATTVELLKGWSDGKHAKEGAQLSALNSKTQQVLVTIGGNNAGFTSFGAACVLLSCSESTDIYKATVKKIEVEVGADLVVAYRKMLDAAPNADFYIATYPNIVPEVVSGLGLTCPYLDSVRYEYSGKHFEQKQWQDAAAARKVLNLLNATIIRAVTSIQVSNPKYTQRVHLVDVTVAGSPFDGHAICDTGASYFNNIDTLVTKGDAFLNTGNALHPNKDGHLAYARLMCSAMMAVCRMQ